MTSVKYSRVKRLAKASRYPRTFRARCSAIPPWLWDTLTAKQIAAIIDSAMDASYRAGYDTGYADARP